jgi:hypothetical protein
MGLVGGASQLVNHYVLPVPSPLASLPVTYGAEGSEHLSGNLLANYDLSWLQGWADETPEGVHAEWLETGFWRLPAQDPITLQRYTEARTLLEIPIKQAGTLSVSVLIRHDGSEFGATLYQRTRTERFRLDTTVEDLGDGLVRLSAVLRPVEAGTRLRALHLVGLSGDWSTMDVGFPVMTLAADVSGFVPHYPLMGVMYGLGNWVGWPLTLLVTGFALLGVIRFLGRNSVAVALLLGLLIQATVALQGVLIMGSTRSSGTVGDPNVLAAVAVIGALAAIVIEPRRSFLVPMLAAALAAVTVVASGSHAGFVGLAILICIAVLRVPVSWVLKTLLAGAAIVAIGHFAFDDVVAGVTSDQNIRARVQVWTTVTRLIGEHPLVGVGGGNTAHFHEFLGPYSDGPQFRVSHAHSILGVAAENGIPLFTLFVLTLLLAVRLAWKLGGMVAAVPIAVLLVMNLADMTFLNHAVFLPAWMGFLAVTDQTRELDGGPKQAANG